MASRSAFGVVMRRVCALLWCAALGTMFIPGCVLRPERGSTEDGERAPEAPPEPAPNDGAGGNASDADAGGLTPEEIFAFQNADPHEMAMRMAVATYAASLTAGLVEAQLVDPATVEPATVSALIEQAAPQAMDEALQWFASIDPSTLPTSGGVVVNFECEKDPHRCPFRTTCAFDGIERTCAVSSCGTGRCPYCPFAGNLIFKAWCAYGCLSGEQVVGGAFILRTIFDNYNGPWCIGW